MGRAFRAVHRTWLAPDGSGKAPLPVARKVLGAKSGAAIRFAPARARLLVGEGIETTLSVRQALPRRACWAGIDLHNMARLALPPEVRVITLLMDNDMKDPTSGPKALEAARLHYGRAEVKVRAAWPPPGTDFNDIAMEEGR